MLADREFRDAVRAELASPDDLPPVQRRVGQGPRGRDRPPENAGLEQRTIAEIARERCAHPLDMMLDLAIAEHLQTVFTAQLLNSDEEAVGRMLNHPNSIVSLSDAGAHLTFFNDAGFGLHLLGHWVRERGVMAMEEAVRKLTSHPAAVLRD